MTEVRKIKTFKDTNYFAQGTYKREFVDYMSQIGIVTMITKTLLAPLQRWRIIKQTQQFFPLRPEPFTGFTDYIKRIPQEQGVKSFWRGNGAGLWLFFTQTFLQVGLYDNINALCKEICQDEQPDSFFRDISARMFFPIISSFFTQLITYPVDTARVRLSMNFTKQIAKSPFSGVRTCLSHIIYQQNFTSIYKGFLLSNVISLINFNLYLAFASVFSSVQVDQNYSNLINGDTIAAVSALVLVHPLDTLKKIIQLDNLSSPSIFKHELSAVNYIKRDSSLKSLYNGLTISVVKSLMFLPTYFIAHQLMTQSKKKISETF